MIFLPVLSMHVQVVGYTLLDRLYGKMRFWSLRRRVFVNPHQSLTNLGDQIHFPKIQNKNSVIYLDLTFQNSKDSLSMVDFSC